MNFSTCPECGGQLNLHKDTSSGQEFRDYNCPACGWSETVDRGTATWKAISDALLTDEPKEGSSSHDSDDTLR